LPFEYPGCELPVRGYRVKQKRLEEQLVSPMQEGFYICDLAA
jgi:hypothetical protein